MNYTWEYPQDIVFLLFWSALLFGITGAVIGALVAVTGRLRKLDPHKTVFLMVTILATIFLFVDRFSWCYPCHQFLDTRAPHLVYTPAKSFMLTAALAVGCVAVATLAGAIAYLLVKFWRARRVRIAVYAVVAGGLAVAVLVSILSTPTLRIKTYTPEEAGIPVRQGGVDRVLLIVDDGITWDVIDSLMVERRLPTYKHMVQNGVRGHLATLSPTLSPPIWTTLATGHSRLRHGVGSFVNYAYPGMKHGVSVFPCPTRMMLQEIFLRFQREGFGSSRPLGPSYRKVRAIWNIAGNMNIDVGIVGWRYTWPVEDVHGVMVSDCLHRERPKNHVHPAELSRYVISVIREIPAVDVAAFTPCRVESLAVDPQVTSRLNLFKHFIQNDLKYQAVADSLFTLLHPTFMAIGLTSVDAIEHLFYYEHALAHESRKYAMTRSLQRFTSDELVRCVGGIVDSTYIFHDRLMQHWLDWIGEDDVLIVVSDHGHVMDGSAHHYPEPGVLLMYGKPFRKGLNLSGASVYDIVPTVLYLLGLPVPEDMPGKVLEKAMLGAYMDDNPVRTVKSYETSELQPLEPPPEVDDELLERLKALGYIR